MLARQCLLLVVQDYIIKQTPQKKVIEIDSDWTSMLYVSKSTCTIFLCTLLKNMHIEVSKAPPRCNSIKCCGKQPNTFDQLYLCLVC